jgi:beta-mannosidase
MRLTLFAGRWKVLHYIAKDVYRPVIISPFYNITTGDFQIYVTSDLWSPATGTASFQWYQWDGVPITNISTPSTTFTVGALNTTRVYATTIDKSTLNYNNAILYMNITAEGQLPNTNTTTAFTHENFFHARSLAEAELIDPGITLTYSADTDNFTVEATSAIAVWTWLDYPAGVLLNFDSNGFLLLPGQPREISYTLKSDTTNGSWVNKVTVESLWNNTLAY